MHTCRRRENISAGLLISGQVGERLIHLVGDRFVLTALVYHHVCNAKGKVLGSISRTVGCRVSADFYAFYTFHNFLTILIFPFNFILLPIQNIYAGVKISKVSDYNILACVESM